eukprot:6436717-Amphidinium_carterae.1
MQRYHPSQSGARLHIAKPRCCRPSPLPGRRLACDPQQRTHSRLVAASVAGLVVGRATGSRGHQERRGCVGMRAAGEGVAIWSLFEHGDESSAAVSTTSGLRRVNSDRHGPHGERTVVECKASANAAVQVLTTSQIEWLAISHQSVSPTAAQRKKGEEEKLLCLAMYAGETVDFGSGPYLYIDATCDDAKNALDEFRAVFESEQIPKVYHNYSHMMSVLHTIYGDDFTHAGFAGDVMHMGRLADASQPCTLHDMSQNPDYKVGVALRRENQTRMAWQDFACMHSFVIFALRHNLEQKLRDTPLLPQGLRLYKLDESQTLWDFYLDYWLEFAIVIQQMQDAGIAVSSKYLRETELEAKAEREKLAALFFDWVNKRSLEQHGHELENLRFLKVGSDNMLRVLLFGDTVYVVEEHATMEVKVPIADYEAAMGRAPAAPEAMDIQTSDTPSLKEECKRRGLKYGGTRSVLVRRLTDPQEHDYPKRKRVWQTVTVEMRSLNLGLFPHLFTEGGMPSVSEPCLRRAMEEANLDEESQAGIEILLEIKDLDHLLSSFVVPLQEHAKKTGRIHSSCNLNTETGRLSSVNPNLQNQPSNARYDVRKAFVAGPANKLVVADYGQLELRVVAHLANCKAAFARNMIGHSQPSFKKGT